MIGLLLRFTVIDQTSLAWPGQTKFLADEPQYLNLFGAALFNEMKNYILSFRQYSVGHLISATDFQSDSNGNCIRWRLFANQDDYDLFKTISGVEFDNVRLDLAGKMNITISEREITDPAILSEISALVDPTYDDYNRFI